MEFFPPHRVYVEPYGGAASVLMQKPPVESEIYNDLDEEVVNVFQVLRDPATAQVLCEQLVLTPFARDEFELAYEPAEEPIERARRTIIRAFMGFGSASFNSAHATGFRVYAGTNRQHRPHQDWTSYPPQIAAFAERLQGVIIENRPALDVILRHQTDETLFYVDPPYPLSTRGAVSGVRQKYRYEMTDEDHIALADVLHAIKGMVVVSGYACEFYDLDLYADWERHEKQTMADGANPRTEVLWLNPACVNALKRDRRQGQLIESPNDRLSGAEPQAERPTPSEG
jgi:DNA adenine methylase